MSRKSNPGAHEAMESVVSELAAELSRGSNMNTKDATAAVGLQVVGAPPAGLPGHGKADGTRFILYLSNETCGRLRMTAADAGGTKRAMTERLWETVWRWGGRTGCFPFF